nr:unnamed protein product [Callosobruchus analis]
MNPANIENRRIKKIRQIEGHKICCSPACEKILEHNNCEVSKLQDEIKTLKCTLDKKEDEVVELQINYESEYCILNKTIENLNKDNADRETYSNRIKKRMIDLEDEATEMEIIHNDEMKKQKEVICKLYTEISMLKQMNENLQKSIDDHIANSKIIIKERDDLIQINQELVTTIGTLEEQNGILSIEQNFQAHQVRHSSANEAEDSNNHSKSTVERIITLSEGAVTCDGVSEEGYLSTLDSREQTTGFDITDTKSLSLRKKILIIGDELAVSIATNLDSALKKSDHDISGTVKPNADIFEISKVLFQSTRHCGQDDLVIFMFNSCNVSNFKTLRHALKQLLPIGKFTNLLILTRYNSHKDKIIGRFIEKQIDSYMLLQINVSISFGELYSISSLVNSNIIRKRHLTIPCKVHKPVLKTVDTILNNNVTQKGDKFFRV